MAEESLLSQTENVDASVDQEAVSDVASQEVAGESVATVDEGVNKGEGEAEAGAPETYADFSLPEGYSVEDTMLIDYQSYAQDNNLSQEAAQAGVDLVVKMKTEEAEGYVREQQTWVESIKADTELGGDKFDASLATAFKARDKYASPELIDLLNTSGLGNHPEVFRLFHNVGKSLSEDQLVTGSAGNQAQSHEKVLYPNMN
ncbi:MAG: hypothetical protein ABGY43_10090 [bacterium]|jgi:hypothetical protein